MQAFLMIVMPFALPISAAANIWRYRLGKQKSDYLWLGVLLFWASCALFTRDNSYWTLVLSTLLAWLSYKMLYRWGEQASKFTEQKLAWSYGLLLGIVTLVLLGVMIYNLQWFSLPFWISASIFAHTVFLFAVIVYMLSPTRWVRVLCFIFTLGTILITGNQETIYAWCLVFIIFSFFAPSAKKQLALLEPIIISLLLVAMMAFSSVLGWNVLGFVIDVLPNQQHNLVQGSETTRGYWWKKQGVDFTTSEALIGGQSHIVFTVEKTEEEPWRRLQQIIPITSGQPYTVSTWIQNNDDTKPGIQGWGQLAQSKDTFVITGELRDGQWLANATALGTLVDSGVAEIAGEWTRVWLTFVYEGAQKELSFFLGLTPDQQRSIGTSNSFAGFQVEKGTKLSDYVAGAANRGVDLQTARLPYWQAAWQGFLEKPWLGHGEETFSDYYRETWPDKGRLGQIPPHAHNLYLQFLFEKGLLGFLGLVALLLLVGLPAIRQGDLLFSTLFFSILIINFFDGTLFSMSLLYPLAAFSAWRQASYQYIERKNTLQQIGVKVVLSVMDYSMVFYCFTLILSIINWLNLGNYTLTSIAQFTIILWPLFMLREGLYPGYGLTLPQEIHRQVKANSIASLIFLITTQIFTTDMGLPFWILAIVYTINIFLLPLGRFIIKKIMHHFHIWGKKVIILGAGQAGQKITKALQQTPLDGLHPVALFDDNISVGTEYEGVAVKGKLARADRFAQVYHIDHAIVAMPSMSPEKLVELTRQKGKIFPIIQFVPELIGLPTESVRTSNLDGLLALELRHGLYNKGNQFIKRATDLIGSLSITLLTLPILILLYIWIRLDSKGSAFYWSKRLGQDGQVFSCLKFRSMYMDADERLNHLMATDEAIRKEYEEFHKLENDPRITRAGKIIRKFSLDELSQLFNVIKGDMSLVGPRPYMTRELDDMHGQENIILEAKPGMTGYWQVSGRNTVTFDERLAMEAHYVRNWSLWWDIILLFKTVTIFFSKTSKGK